MCCGRGIKAAASKQYTAPPIHKENTMTSKYHTYKPMGAYYGNPIPPKTPKQVKKEAEIAKHEASDKEALALLHKAHVKK